MARRWFASLAFLAAVAAFADTLSTGTAVPGMVGGRQPLPWMRKLEDERWLAFTLLLPTAILLGLFIAYPFVKGVWLSLTSTTVGNVGAYVGLKNFVKIWNDTIFQRAAYNTFVYTGVATLGKLVLGMWLALLPNRHFRGKRLVRASMLLPFIIPAGLTATYGRMAGSAYFSK